MTKFVLHPQLAKDCLVIGEFSLCQLLLMNDRHYPWFILVPQRDNLREIHHLDAADQDQLWQESRIFSAALEKHFQADNLNIAALGNVVPQLHIHHIVRYQHDAAWPKPIWGLHAPQPYTQNETKQLIDKLREAHIEGLNLYP